MSYQYHGKTNLIALPNRTVQTYPSGLVRVERSFVCRKNQADRYRAELRVNEPMPLDDGRPAIDGLFIFPEPQEAVRDDGFVEFRVTAYGRTNEFSNIALERNSARGAFFINDILAGSSAQQSTINETYTRRGVLASSQSPELIIGAPAIEDPIVLNLITGQRVQPGVINFGVIQDTGLIAIEVTAIQILLDNFSSTNFGRWNEYVVTWQAIGSRFIYAAQS